MLLLIIVGWKTI